MSANRTSYNFTAILSLFPTSNGGRKKPVYDNYRPSFSFNSANHFSGEISFPEVNELKPGDTTSVMVKIIPSRHINHHLKSGDSFTILEGDRVVGSGVIKHIIQSDPKELVS